MLVTTTTSSARRAIRDQLGLVPWEDAGGGAAVCENVHRAKGLEADAVILVGLEDDPDDTLLYVGVSRAVTELVVVGTQALGDRLGLR